MKRRGFAIGSLAAWSVLALWAAPAQAWWNSAWSCRRVVTVPDYRPTKLPGDDVAVVTMPTGGLCRADGADLRVATADDQELPCRVLMTGPGDQVRVAFAARGGGKYFVYFGNPKAEPPAKEKELDIRRGVLLEMWEFPGGALRTLAQAEDALRRAKKLLGRDFRDRIWSGHNPFGSEAAIAAVYTAWLNVPAEGEYDFALSSQNASFLLVDGNLLLDNGGAHGPQVNGSRSARIKLAPGLVKLTYYHVSNGGDPIAVLAWCPPAERNKQLFTFVPPGAFSPVLLASPGAMEQYAQAAGIDFLYDHAGETFVENRYYQRLAFNALAAGQTPRALQWKWDFGDGQTSAEPQPQHVYLLPGEYKVQLSANPGGAALTRVNRVLVSRPWDHVTENKLDAIREDASIVQKYDFKALSPDAAAEAVILLHRVSMADGVIRAGEALSAATQTSPHGIVEAMPYYVKTLLAAGKADEAVSALAKAAERNAGSPAVSAELLVQAGRVALEDKDDPKRAGELFQQVIEKNQALAGPAVLRLARIGLGDVYRYQGDGEKARKAYEDAHARPVDRPGGVLLAKGDYARHVEEYIRTRDYETAEEYLDQWGEAFPLDRLEGFWSLLRARLAFERGLFSRAVREAQVLAKANPSSNYAAEALMLAADAWGRLKQPAKAAEVLRQIAKDYPESPFAAEAAKTLKKNAAP
jgi:tetratricopeptide (TPR) repeat protein